MLHDHWYKRDVGDPVTHKSIPHKLRAQGSQVHDTGSAHKRANKPHHEINRMIRRKNAEIPYSRPKGIPRGQRPALLQIILVRQHASLGPSARARGVDDASDIVALSHDKIRRALALKIFPAKSSAKITL